MEANTVLIIDDTEIIRKALTNFCKKRGIVAVTASTMEEGIEKFKECPEKYKLIFTDYNLDENDPSKNGFNLAKAMNTINPNHGKMIIMSGGNISFLISFIDDMDKSEYSPHGFCCFLKKPVKKGDFEKLMTSFGL